MSDTSTDKSTKTQTASQRARVERNRQKALLLRQSRLNNRPYEVQPRNHTANSIGTSYTVISAKDTDGGFFLDEELESSSTQTVKPKIVHQPAPIQFIDKLFCDECGKEFQDSYLFNYFEEPICDSCRTSNEKYELVTRTRAKETFNLKDSDLDRREPILKFILKRNPHNERWGEMRLYLSCQIQKRAMEVWGSEDEVQKQTELKSDNREKSKQKKFDKKIKELRNAVRSSLWRKDLGNHEHKYGEESYNSDDDMYSKTCSDCGHVLSYEKM